MTIVQSLVAGRYRLIESLGAGGMGNVWLARDEVLEREVAIKEVLLPFGLDDCDREDLVVRTVREARAAARLSHPNVVGIYDVLRAEDRPWIVMEYVPARSLMDAIKRDGPLPVVRVAEIGLAVLAALTASHRAGVLHRDVKPSNILLAYDGRAVLTDFGLATFEDGDNAPTRPGLILGSPNYIAPERARYGVSTPATDLWSLGATLYSAVEGRSPYARSTAVSTLTALAVEPPDPPRRAGALQPVLEGLLRKDPRARMRSAEVELLLRRVAAGETVPAAVPPPQLAPARAQAQVTPARAQAQVAPALVSPARARPASGFRRLRWVAASMAVGALAVSGSSLAASAGGPQRPGATVWSKPSAEAPVAAPAAAAAVAQAPQAGASTEAAPPAGMVWYRDPRGFRVAVPATWPAAVPAEAQRVYLCQPDGSRMLEVGPWQPSDTDLVASLTRAERQAKLRGYQRIRIESVSDARAAAAAEWEYVFTDPKMGRLHGISRGFVVGGHSYLIEWRTSIPAWQSSIGTYSAIVDSFRAPHPGRLPV